jgi:hypothetical protein
MRPARCRAYRRSRASCKAPIPCGLDAGGTLVCWHNNGHIEVGPRTDDPVVRFTRLAPAATMALAVDAYDPPPRPRL